MHQDLKKAHALAPNAWIAATVLMTTPTSPWEPTANAAVAYASGNRHTARDRSSLRRATEAMVEALQPLGPVHHLRIGRGTAFGSNVTTTLFVVQTAAQLNEE